MSEACSKGVITVFRLTTERQKKGWSQAELGRRIGIDPATISRLEAGKIYAYSGYRRRLGQALGVPGDKLFEEVPDDGRKM